MSITVQFLGVARQLAGTTQCTVGLAEGDTFRTVLSRLADRFPPLAGQVIDAAASKLMADQRILIDGRHEVTDLDAQPGGGQTLILMQGDV